MKKKYLPIVLCFLCMLGCGTQDVRDKDVGNKTGVDTSACGMSSKIDPLFRLNLTHPNVFRVWVSFFIISDFYTVF